MLVCHESRFFDIPAVLIQNTVAMQIIIDPLEKAILSLEEVVNMPVDDIIRDSTIQRFEYTFELSWKMIKRFLKEAFEIETDEMSYAEIAKNAAKKGIIRNPDLWLGFRKARNYTSHAYSEMAASESYSTSEVFLPEAKILLEKLKQINENLI
jgi:nucleotidyltransferase substrate binding protein (TIGR01987 family)